MSPIESSSSDETEAAAKPGQKSSANVSASDISDTDFAVNSEGEKEPTSEEADLEYLEKQRAAITVIFVA